MKAHLLKDNCFGKVLAVSEFQSPASSDVSLDKQSEVSNWAEQAVLGHRGKPQTTVVGLVWPTFLNKRSDLEKLNKLKAFLFGGFLTLQVPTFIQQDRPSRFT